MISAAINYLRSFFQNPLNVNDIICPLTQEILIEPVKTNCGHYFEKVALATQLRTLSLMTRNNCSLCRSRITSAELDPKLKLKIQNQFAEVSEANQTIFDNQTRELTNEEGYSAVREAPVISPSSVSKGDEILPEYRELAAFLESGFPRSPPADS